MDPMSVDRRYQRICSAATLQSEPKGFFGGLVNNLEANLGPAWIMEFGKLRTDEERVRFCQRRSEVREALSGVGPIYREKDASMTERLLREASAYLQQGELSAVLLRLNRAAVRAPPGKPLGAVLWTRSGALIAAGNWIAGRADVESALIQGLPDERRAEAFVRIGRCHLALGDAARARIAFQLGKKLAADNKDTSLQVAADRALKKLEVGEATPPSTPDGFLVGGMKNPLVTDPGFGKCQTIPHVDDDVVTVAAAPGAGRFLVAARKVRPAETLLVESPLAVVPLPDRAGTRCHHCLSRLDAARGCPRCSGVAFCSPECASAAETYHKTECRFLGLLEGAGASALTLLAFRLITQKPLTFFQNLKRTSDDKNGIIPDEDISSYKKVFSLEGHDDLRPHDEMFYRTIMALLLLRILQQSSYFNQTSKAHSAELSEDEAMIGGLLLRLLQVLQFNAHEVYETLLPLSGIRKGRPLPLAIAVYPRASLFNHSCNPNVTRYFIGTTLVAASIRPLKKGAVTADSYGTVFSRQTLAERWKWLASRYWFICSCEACQENWPLFADLPQNDRYQEAGSEIFEAEATMDIGDTKKATDILVRLLESTKDSRLPPPRWVMQAQEALKACLTASGNIYRLDANAGHRE